MQVLTFSALYVLLAICFIMTVAAEVFIDDFVRPRSMFVGMLVGTIITSVAALAINIDIPD
jgi:hypothetical protein